MRINKAGLRCLARWIHRKLATRRAGNGATSAWLPCIFTGIGKLLRSGCGTGAFAAVFTFDGTLQQVHRAAQVVTRQRPGEQGHIDETFSELEMAVSESSISEQATMKRNQLLFSVWSIRRRMDRNKQTRACRRERCGHPAPGNQRIITEQFAAHQCLARRVRRPVHRVINATSHATCQRPTVTAARSE